MSVNRGLPARRLTPNATAAVVGVLHPDPDTAPQQARRSEHRRKFTTALPADLAEEVRDAVVWLPTQGARVTVAGLGEQAPRRELDRLRDAHHDGRPFPPRTRPPPSGRPVV